MAIQIVSQEEAERCDYIICARAGTPTPFHDNVIGTCCKCGSGIIFRPHAPINPKRICMECAVATLPQEASNAAPPKG
jgi:hypothetical protein